MQAGVFVLADYTDCNTVRTFGVCLVCVQMWYIKNCKSVVNGVLKIVLEL